MNKDFVDKGVFEDSSAGKKEVATISGLGKYLKALKSTESDRY